MPHVFPPPTPFASGDEPTLASSDNITEFVSMGAFRVLGRWFPQKRFLPLWNAIFVVQPSGVESISALNNVAVLQVQYSTSWLLAKYKFIAGAAY